MPHWKERLARNTSGDDDIVGQDFPPVLVNLLLKHCRQPCSNLPPLMLPSPWAIWQSSKENCEQATGVFSSPIYFRPTSASACTACVGGLGEKQTDFRSAKLRWSTRAKTWPGWSSFALLLCSRGQEKSVPSYKLRWDRGTLCQSAWIQVSWNSHQDLFFPNSPIQLLV